MLGGLLSHEQDCERAGGRGWQGTMGEVWCTHAKYLSVLLLVPENLYPHTHAALCLPAVWAQPPTACTPPTRPSALQWPIVRRLTWPKLKPNYRGGECAFTVRFPRFPESFFCTRSNGKRARSGGLNLNP